MKSMKKMGIKQGEDQKVWGKDKREDIKEEVMKLSENKGKLSGRDLFSLFFNI